MSFTHKTVVTYTTAAGQIASSTLSQTASTEESLDTTINAGVTNQHFVLGVTASEIVSFVLFSTQAITIKTNSSSSPAQTFPLKAGEVITWNQGQTAANPITTTITDLYITNAGATNAGVSLRFLVNQ